MSNIIIRNCNCEEQFHTHYAVNSNNGQEMGRVDVYPQYVSNRLNGARILGMNLHVDPNYEHLHMLKNHLLREAVAHAQTLKNGFDEKLVTLSATFAGTDDMNIAYLTSRGFDHYESHYTLQRDLSEPIPDRALPINIEVEEWRMESEAEKYAYLDAYSSIYFADDSKTIESLEESPIWKTGTTFTAFYGDEIVGSVAVWQENPDVGITEYVFVRPEWRRKGVASYLMTQAMRYLQAQGVTYAQMQVGSHNPSAISAFKKLGYELVADTVSLGLAI